MSIEPQSTIVLTWCDQCGRNNRWTSLKPHHFDASGYRCTGTLHQLTYALDGAA